MSETFERDDASSEDGKGENHINNPHDSYFQEMIARPQVNRELLMEHLPAEVLKRVDLDSVKPTNHHFVDKELKHLYSDCLLEGKIDDKPGFFYVLVEHQSSYDYWMPQRMLQYVSAIWSSVVKGFGKKRNKLPFIYPLLVSTGKRPKDATTDLRDLIDGPRDLIDEIYWNTPMINLTQSPNEKLAIQPHLGLLWLTLKYGAEDEGEPPMLDVIMVQLKKTDEPIKKDLLLVSVGYIVYTRDDLTVDDVKESVDDHFSSQKGEYVMSLADQLIEKGKIEGKREGKREGKFEGKAEVAREMLKNGFAEDLILKLTGLNQQMLTKLKAQSV